MIKNFKAKVEACYEAALFQKDKVENGGWKKFRTNYLREHCAARFGIPFSNDDSPTIFDEVVKQHPEMARWIKHKRRKQKTANKSNGQRQGVWTF